MIKLTLIDGRPLWINLSRIAAVSKLEGQPDVTHIASGQAGVWWNVKEEPEAVVALISHE